MALKTETKRIGGVDYLIGQITATRSVKLIARLGRVLGPALAEIARFFPEGGESFAEQEIDFAAAGDVVRKLFATLDDAEIDGLMRELLSNVAVLGENGGPLDGDLKKIDAHFSGRLDALFGVLFASVGVNFGGFFGVLAAIAPANMKAAMAAALTRAGLAPSGSTGSST